MKRYFHIKVILLVLVFVAGAFMSPNAAVAASASEISRDAKSTLEELCAESPSARAMRDKAKGILVFPSIVKGGFMVGGQYGEGALLRGGKVSAYYSTLQMSYGLQVGLQKYGYVLFFMTEPAFNYLNKSDGWELGVGPSIVVVDEGKARSMTTTTMQSDIYAFFFNQTGLMGGLGLQGTKITKIEK